MMRLARDFIDKPVFSAEDGRRLGELQDFYLDRKLERIAGIRFGEKKLFRRTHCCIRQEDVLVLGADVVLVTQSGSAYEDELVSGLAVCPRLGEVSGREIVTPGGTHLGRIGDVILDKNEVIGFGLSHVFVEGPIAINMAISREAITDPDRGDGAYTADLVLAERSFLRVERGTIVKDTGSTGSLPPVAMSDARSDQERSGFSAQEIGG